MPCTTLRFASCPPPWPQRARSRTLIGPARNPNPVGGIRIGFDAHDSHSSAGQLRQRRQGDASGANPGADPLRLPGQRLRQRTSPWPVDSYVSQFLLVEGRLLGSCLKRLSDDRGGGEARFDFFGEDLLNELTNCLIAVHKCRRPQNGVTRFWDSNIDLSVVARQWVRPCYTVPCSTSYRLQEDAGSSGRVHALRGT